jgi:KDO2-lipid IV(A) lauroyltransferase
MNASASAWLVEDALPLLPPALDLPIARVAGTLAYRMSAGARQAVRENLSIVVPERSDREALVRRTFVEQVRHYLEIFRLARYDRERIRAMVGLTGWEHFTEAVARGKGVVVTSAHVGPVSVCGQIIASNGYDITMPVEKESGELARAVNRARSRMGARFIETESALGIHRILTRGGVLGVLGDRAVTGVGERVPFFGREALLPSAHVVLAIRTGAALIPGFAHRDANGIRADFEPELVLPRTGDRDADVREGVRRWAEVLERHIRMDPAAWSVFEPVWRR